MPKIRNPSTSQIRGSGLAIAIKAARLASACAAGRRRSSRKFFDADVCVSGPFHPARAGMKSVFGLSVCLRICRAVGLMGLAQTTRLMRTDVAKIAAFRVVTRMLFALYDAGTHLFGIPWKVAMHGRYQREWAPNL